MPLAHMILKHQHVVTMKYEEAHIPSKLSAFVLGAKVKLDLSIEQDYATVGEDCNTDRKEIDTVCCQSGLAKSN